MSAYNRYTPAQQELRDLVFASSSSNIVGARYVTGWSSLDSRSGSPAASGETYLPTNVAASLAASRYENNDDAGWVSVPSVRIVKRRERAVQRRKMREAESGMWYGRIVVESDEIADNIPYRMEWVTRKDGSHHLVSRPATRYWADVLQAHISRQLAISRQRTDGENTKKQVAAA